MAHRKAGGTARNLKDSNPKYLGTKLYAGEQTKSGSIIIRQRGTVILAGRNTALGRDHTVYATKEGVVSFADTRRANFHGAKKIKKIVHVD